MHLCIQDSGVPTHHCISERVAQAQDCHENTGENVSSASPWLATVNMHSMVRVCVKLNPRTAKSWSSAEARKCVKFCCTHFQSCKMIIVAFCLTHVITDITPNGISFSLLIESNFKDWEFCRDTLKHCVFIATTIRNLYNYRLYMYTTFPNFH